MAINMVHELSGTEFEELKEAFCKLDTDGNGFISDEELIASSMCTKEDVEAMRALYDVNKDGKIEFCEYLKAMAEIGYAKGEPKLGIMQLYRAFDENGDGAITKEEIKLNVLLPSPVDKIAELLLCDMFDDFDKDRDGKINQEEFTNLVIASKLFADLTD